ncbi:MAG: choice-of-anchor Q domain-containing protein, partial [Planctomycetota bacterium]
MKRTILLSFAFLSVTAASAWPATRLVPSQYATVQDAINACVDGDAVIVAPGTYTGAGNRNINFFGKAITVRSTDPNDPNIVAATIIDCNGSGRGFHFHSGEDADSILAGLTITNGYAYEGAGIYCYDSGPTITNCTISNNTGRWYGAGIYCFYASPTITNCLIGGNWAERGGGMCNEGGSPTVSNCTISANRAADGGGGMFSDYASPTVTNCTFNGNWAAHEGGGMSNWGGNSTVTNCIFSGNSAGQFGGGGVHNRDADATFTNCTFIENTAYGSDAGGMGNYSSSVSLTNCILWHNWPQQIVGGSVTYSNVQGGWEGEGNIDADPCLAFSADFHLMAGSPCIDAGTNTPVGGLSTTGIDGNPRPLDGNGDSNAVTDMGAYEYNPGSPSIAASRIGLFIYDQAWPEPRQETLLIRNSATGTLHWEILEDCQWLQVSPTSGTSFGRVNTVTLTVDSNGLTTGDYFCILTVVDQNAVNSPVMIPVLLHIGTFLRVPQHFATIQEAIDAAVDYDVVLVADGNYTGAGNTNLDLRGKPITVCSKNGPNNCIIDCEGSGRAFYFHSRETPDSLVRGFTLTNGNAPYGGAIWCRESHPTINNCLIVRNSADEGGAIHCDQSKPTITDCTITHNLAKRYGGGIHCKSSEATITGCTIVRNSAGRGGGMATSGRAPTVADCSFIQNTAYAGGGVRNYYTFSLPNLTLTNCLFSGNRARYYAGGLDNHYSGGRLTNCTFVGNRVLRWGAGGFATGGHWDRTSLRNCIFRDNLPRQILSESPDDILVSYSNIQGGWAGTGNIDGDPCFVGPGHWDANGTPDEPADDFWVDGDYHLLPGSPCINTGEPNYIPQPQETDLDG